MTQLHQASTTLNQSLKTSDKSTGDKLGKTPGKTSHWILLRGLARESRHWDDFPNKLAAKLHEQNETARIDALDMPGSGRYSEMKSPITIGELTEFAREKFIEIRRKQRELGEVPSERTRLVAVSMGGMIAADWMDRWPDDFKEAVLINTSFQGFSPFYDRLRPSAMTHLLSTLRPLTHFDREMKSMELVTNTLSLESKQAIAKKWARYAKERPFSLENFTRQLLASARYRAPAKKPDVPTLVLYSENDRMVSPDCSKEIIRRWKTDFDVHPTAGHDLTLDDPDWVVEKAIEWERHLNEIPPTQAVYGLKVQGT
jgi:pimeloyl-ACP methyl ester carboxylesterase